MRNCPDITIMNTLFGQGGQGGRDAQGAQGTQNGESGQGARDAQGGQLKTYFGRNENWEVVLGES